MRKTSIASVTLFAAIPALVSAWPLCAQDMGGPPVYGGYPGFYGQPYGMPPAPMAPGYPGGWWPTPYGGEAAAPLAGEGQGQPAVANPSPPGGGGWGGYQRPLGAMPMIPRLDIARGMDGDDYLIDIRVENIDPEQIQIRPARRGLVISYDKAIQTNQEDTLAGGEGYRRSYSVSRGTTTRRLGLPVDARLDQVSREVSEGHIRLRIPRDSSTPPLYR
ncbi:Hsp20/alpha crystallin family protein [Thiocystis violacea]|uniref:Hsp20/alpha crystallin family protein n=1 Tax=Thiocystis violacea TaxID=13725 RepID=UPI0019030DC4|nr:Hsp20/alpha crystallin family protein [Thiocystis violacea]MBK1724617.1 hypothetical protein [Thiocystis violacea]